MTNDPPALQAVKSFLEYHFYSGGLRIVPLGSAKRPPELPPADWAGFRDEFELQNGDFVVEFARTLYAGNRVTWLGLYARASDAVFGDRQNHTGVGIWLIGHDIARANLLLSDLRQVLDAIAPDNAAGFANDINALQSDFLPKYVTKSIVFPDPLGGYKYNPNPAHNTAVMLAREDANDGDWISVADQIARVSVLCDPNDLYTRLLLLVPRDRIVATGKGLVEIGSGLASEIMVKLPVALEALVSREEALRIEHDRVTAECGDVKTKLADAEAGIQKANREIADLVAQLSENDEATRLRKIAINVDSILRGVERTETTLQALRRETQNTSGELKDKIRNLGLATGETQVRQKDDNYVWGDMGGPRKRHSSLGDQASGNRLSRLMWALPYVLIALAVSFILWMVVSRGLL